MNYSLRYIYKCGDTGVGRAKKIDKAIHFSEKDAQMLSGFTRRQLQKLDESGLIVPQRLPMIVYSWNQLIFLRVLFEFRQDWTFKQLEVIFKKFPPQALDLLLERIEISLAGILILESDEHVNFQLVENITFKNDFTNYKLKKAVENIQNNVRLDQEQALAIIEHVATDQGEDYSNSRVSIKKQTLVIIPLLIRDLKNVAQELEIENFDLKVG